MKRRRHIAVTERYAFLETSSFNNSDSINLEVQ